jgi:hypothetical protein
MSQVHLAYISKAPDGYSILALMLVIRGVEWYLSSCLVFYTFDMVISLSRMDISLYIILCSFYFASFIQRCGKLVV